MKINILLIYRGAYMQESLFALNLLKELRKRDREQSL